MKQLYVGVKYVGEKYCFSQIFTSYGTPRINKKDLRVLLTDQINK